VSLNTNEDMVGSAHPNCTDVDGDPVTYSIASQPTHGSAMVVGGQLQYTPGSNYTGSDSFTYRSSDGVLNSAPATVSVTVTAVNDAPICQSVLLNTNEDMVGSATPNCSDVDGDPVTYSIASQPSHGSAAVAGGQLQYTPSSDYSGADSFTYRANDGLLSSAPATVSVTVASVNDVPVCRNVSLNTEEDTVGTTAPNCSDLEGDPLTYDIASQPAYGSAAVAGSQLEYTPEADYNGLDSFTYIANDGALDSLPSAVNVSVGVANDLPTAENDTSITEEDTNVSIDVLANDSDPDGGVLSVTGASDPSHGEVEIQADGTIAYTPQTNYYGSDSFTYEISDGQGGIAQALVTVTVTAVNDAPATNDDDFQTRYLTTLTVLQPAGLLANDSDLESDSLSVVLVSGPVHGQLTLNPDGSFTYTPFASATRLDIFTYYCTDGAASSPVATVTIAIQAQSWFLPLVMR